MPDRGRIDEEPKAAQHWRSAAGEMIVALQEMITEVQQLSEPPARRPRKVVEAQSPEQSA
jgi:hypothetical protein